MKIDVSRESQIAREIGQYEYVLNRIANDLQSYKADVNSGWKATEMAQFNRVLDEIIVRLGRTASSLSAVESEIISTAQTIRREEEAREAAERAAREAAERAEREAAMKQR